MTTLSGRQVHAWSMHWPSAGQWRADLILTDGESPTGRVTIESGSLALVGKVLRSGQDAADRPHVTVIGGKGWQSSVAAPVSFHSDGGVKLRTVLRELAGYAKEQIELPEDRVLGDYYELVASRPGEPVRYADALNTAVRLGYISTWRVDPDGVTRFTARSGSEVNSRLTQLVNNKGVGVSTYGLDDPAQVRPGNTISGDVIERVDLRETDGRYECDVFTSMSAATLREQIRRIVASEIGDRCRTYQVVACHSDGRCDLTPPPDAPHLPEMRNVEQWIMGGATFNAQSGDEAVVEFRDEHKTRPVITGFRRKSGSDPSSFPPAARIGDLIQCGGMGAIFNVSDLSGNPLVMVNASLIPTVGPWLISFGAVPPTPVMASPLYGTITSGSSLFGVKR